MRFIRTFIMLIAAFFAASTPTRADATALRCNVLFIGNSYTMYNDMPTTVVRMGRKLGYDLRATVRAVGGYSLTAHREDADTLKAIDAGGWDVVVVQNHSLVPGRPPETVARESLPDAKFLVDRIRAASPRARIVYFATWGRKDGDGTDCEAQPEVCTFDGHTDATTRGYRIYQCSTGGDLAAVGDAWKRVVHDSPRRRPFRADRLWVADGSHPSPTGSYLAAAVILRTIVGKSVARAMYTAGLPHATVAYLRRIADEG